MGALTHYCSVHQGEATIPPLVFTVAITGHQDIAPALHPAVQAQLGALLERAQAELDRARQASEIDRPRAVSLRFLSALAPGADQIGAKAALDPARRAQGWQLNAILPFARELCADLARDTLHKRNAARSQASERLSEDEIAQAVTAIAALADQADRVLELRDWQPESDNPAEAAWQSRRYATIGQMLVRQADLLIALWDGNPPRGRGGTADVVSEARRSGVPVVWINPARPGEASTMLPDPASGHIPASDIVVRHRHEDSRVRDMITDGTDPAIEAAIAQVLLGNDRKRAICISRYRDEPAPERWIAEGEDNVPQPGGWHRAYARMLYIFLNWPTRLKRRMSEEDRKQGEGPGDLRSYPFTKARREGGGRRRSVLLYPFDFGVDPGQPGTANAAPLLEHAARADALATHLGHQYRSAYVLIFALAPLAVTCAVVSALMLEAAPDWKFLMVVAELATVGWAAAIYLRTRASDPVIEHTRRPGLLRRLFPRSQDTHQRWLDARLIADSQRGAQLLAWVGFAGRRPLDSAATREAEHDDHGDHDAHGGGAGHAAPRTVWAPYYANAIAALPELPLDEATGGPCAAITPPRVAALAQAAGKVIADQLGYHDLNHQRLEALNHRLDTFSLNAIKLAAAISAFYLLLWAVNQPVPSWAQWPAVLDKDSWAYWLYGRFKYGAAFTGAVLPAVAAAAAGIRFQGDFERFAMRSKDTAARLKLLGERAGRLAERARECEGKACTGQPPLFEPLLDLLLDTQGVLDEDLSDWRFAYAARPITFG